MKKSLLLAAVILSTQFLTAQSFAAEKSACTKITKQEVAALFDRWNASLQTKDAAKVAENYAPDAVLLPTVSNTPRTTPEGIKDYFEHFVQKSPKGKIDSSTIRIGCNQASDVGTYTFTLTDKDGNTSEVPARYTYNYETVKGKWLITHHHSSMMPEKAEAAH